MSKVKLVFLGTPTNHELEVYATNDEIMIDLHIEGYPAWIALDKETAIKFQKELKKQISYI